MLRLLQTPVESALLLLRTAHEVAERLGNYYLYQVYNTVQGAPRCACLTATPP